MKSFRKFLNEGKISSTHHTLPFRTKPFFISSRSPRGDFSSDDLDLMTQYVRNSHSVNELLRGKFHPDRGEVSATEMKRLLQIISGMDDLFQRKARTSSRPMTVFRGISATPSLPDLTSGPTKQFLSTTLDRNVANTFATVGAGKTPNHSKLLKIHVEPNVPYLANPTNKFEWENEVIFDRLRHMDIDPAPSRTLTVVGQNYVKPVHLHKARLR